MRFATEIPLEPIRCQTRCLLQGTRLLKQMGRAGNDGQMFFSCELVIGLSIEIDDNVIEAAND